MTPARFAFKEYKDLDPFPIGMGNGSQLKAVGKGTIESYCNSALQKKCILQNVLYVTGLKYSLLSVSSLTKIGLTVHFTELKVAVKNEDKVLISGSHTNGLYTFQCNLSETALVTDLTTWHQRLGHAYTDGILRMFKNNAVNGLHISSSSKSDTACEACTFNKMTRAEIPKTAEPKSLRVLDEVHSDVCGPMFTESIGRAKYFVTFIDKASRWVTVYPIRAKSDVFQRFKEFHITAERQTDRKLKVFQSDNGGEYSGNDFLSYLKEHGIVSRRACAYTPQQNGVAERMNRTLLNMVRMMLHQSKLPKSFWTNALVTAVYIRNRLTCTGLPDSKTPYEIWRGRKPSVAHLRVFGARCWYSTHGEKVDKLDPKAKTAVFIGYAPDQKAYRLWNSNENKSVVSRDVVFDEKCSAVHGLEKKRPIQTVTCLSSSALNH